MIGAVGRGKGTGGWGKQGAVAVVMWWWSRPIGRDMV